MVDSWTRSRRYPDQMRPISGSDTPPLYLPAEQMGCTRRATNLGGPRTTCIIRRPGAMTAIVGAHLAMKGFLCTCTTMPVVLPNGRSRKALQAGGVNSPYGLSP